MKKIHKKAAALLFAVTVAGVPLGTAFLGSTVGANVFAQATEMAAEETAEQEHTEIFPEGQGEEQTAVAQPEEEQAGEQTVVTRSEDLPDEQTAGEVQETQVQADTDAEDTAVESENAVPDTETQETAVQPDVVITITEPDGWQKEQAKAMIQVEDAAGSGSFSVAKVEARISENGSWLDVTQEREVTVTGNCSVYVRVTDQNGQTYTQSRYIECFDQTKPTLSAAANNGVLIIRGTDEGSGVAAIYVNGNEFTELTDNTLKVRLQRADTSYQYFTLQVRDNAGNLSEIYQVANPYYENPDAVSNPSDGTGTEENNNSLPVDASPTAPTSATATVTDYQSTVSGTSSGETETTEQPDTEIAVSDTGTDTGRIQGDIISSTVKGGKEFYTIRTKSGKIFYLIVDMDKTDDNVYLLTEVSENDLLNFTDTDTVTLPQNQAVMESSLPLEIVEQEPETEPEGKEPEEEAKPAEKTANNSGTILLMVLALVGVGGGYYFLKFVRGKKESFEYDDEDEDEEETAYEEDDTETEPEEDTGEEEPENEDSLEDEDYM